MAAVQRAVAVADGPDVPPRFADVHCRGGEMLGLLTEAGDALRVAVDQRDTELFARAMEWLDDAEGAASAVFTVAFQLTEPGG